MEDCSTVYNQTPGNFCHGIFFSCAALDNCLVTSVCQPQTKSVPAITSDKLAVIWHVRWSQTMKWPRHQHRYLELNTLSHWQPVELLQHWSDVVKTLCPSHQSCCWHSGHTEDDVEDCRWCSRHERCPVPAELHTICNVSQNVTAQWYIYTVDMFDEVFISGFGAGLAIIMVGPHLK